MRPKTTEEIKKIRISGKILAQVLDLIGRELKPGMSGSDIENIALEELKRLNGEPVFKGVKAGRGIQDFPSIICISSNDAVVHGIPNENPFNEGDIVGFDFGVSYGGMITDAARTYIVGGRARNKEEEKLVRETKKSLDAGISAVKAGSHVGDISAKVQKVLDSNSLGIVRELVGHGVGHDLHEPPEIPNYGYSGTGEILLEGMTIAIEPMATLGEWRVVVDPDGWTIRTRDGSRSAHFEDTILVTAKGAEVLTRR